MTRSSARPARPSGRLAAAAALTTVLALLLAVAPAPPAGGAPPPDGSSRTVRPVDGEVTRTGRAPTSVVAQSDPELLASTSARAVTVLVRLDYDPLASYRGGLAGLAATSPAVTRTQLSTRTGEAQAYLRYVAGLEAAFEARLRAVAPGAEVRSRLRVVYGGLVVAVPENQAKRLLGLDGVVAVQSDDLRRLPTDSSPGFVGAPELWASLGGQPGAGRGVVVGVLDTGVWPEHPSFAASGTSPPPPPRADTTARTCAFGPDPTAPDPAGPFECQAKLIAGESFLDTYKAVHGDDPYPDSARDGVGHGSHTASTAAGSMVASAPLYGVDRGPISGVAPGAHLAVYKTCGPKGCFPSDVLAAVGEAVLDGVDVINFSVGGGDDPLTDPVATAFLDAYAAGVLVVSAAGNDGPGPGTVSHDAPWVLTVAASRQRREFRTVVTLRADGGARLDLSGASVTGGIATPAPVVVAADVAGYGAARCDQAAPPGLFDGMVVACERGPGRVVKGHNVALGGAVGMLLYNPVPADVLTDNHHLPTVHLDAPEGVQLRDFVAAHPGTTAAFPTAVAVDGTPDVMATFSSRGPGQLGLKPDLAAPGVQILAANTPVPHGEGGSAPGEWFQAIAGTSMAAPHVAGAAALLAATHPDWSPGRVRSALMTTARQGVVKEDLVTPADPFDVGAGRLDLSRATDPGLVVEETVDGFLARAGDPLTATDLNLPSLDAPVVPGQLRTQRTVTNVTSVRLPYRAVVDAPSGAAVDVFPGTFTLDPGGSQVLTLQLDARGLAPGQHFAAITLDQTNGPRDVRLPVAFRSTQAEISLGLGCEPESLRAVEETALCTMTVSNQSDSEARVDVGGAISAELGQRPLPDGVTRPPELRATGADLPVDTAPGTTVVVSGHLTLAGREPSAPVLEPSADPSFAYFPLPDDFFVPIGDESAINITVPSVVYGERSYDRVGVVSNGYVVLGGADEQDISYLPQALPDPRPPNGVLAPYWTDLDDRPPPGGGPGAPGVAVAVVSDEELGTAHLVVEWRMHLFGSAERRTFQLWLGLDGEEDIHFAYDPDDLPGPGGIEGLVVGAENEDGSKGSRLPGPPEGDLRVVTGVPGATVGIPFAVAGRRSAVGGRATVTATLAAPGVPGVAVREVTLAIEP